jgi:hypothetical protein
VSAYRHKSTPVASRVALAIRLREDERLTWAAIRERCGPYATRQALQAVRAKRGA